MSRLSTNIRRAVTVPFVCASGALVVLLASACASGTPNVDSAAEAKVISKLDDDWSAAAATRDAKRVASFYADDAIAYPPGEPVAVGRAAAEKVWAAYFADSSYNLSWKTGHAEVVGTLGYTAGTYADSFRGPDGKTVNGTGKYLCVWKKQSDGSWKAIQDSWNSDSK